MFDARIFLKNKSDLEKARRILEKLKADFKGDYAIHDKIFASKDLTLGLDKVFLRLRVISKNIWKDKPVIVSIKHTELMDLGKQSIIPVKEQFDTEKEAEDFIAKNYASQFEFSYKFDRIGWQYNLGEGDTNHVDQVDLEDIEGNYSIEFKSKTEIGLQKLCTLFDVKLEDIIKGPSAVAVKEILKRSRRPQL